MSQQDDIRMAQVEIQYCSKRFVSQVMMLILLRKYISLFDSPEFKCMAKDFYHLPPHIKLYELVDTCDSRFLNHPHASIIICLRNNLNIEMYNYKRYGTQSKYSPPIFDLTNSTLQFTDSTTIPLTFLTMEKLHVSTKI